MGRRGKTAPPPRQTAAYVDWTEVGPAGWSPREWLLRPEPGFSYRVRLFHRPVQVRLRHRGLAGSDLTSGSEDDLSRAILPQHAIWVLDRSDGQFKVLTGPLPLFLAFRRFGQLTGIEPGGEDAGDFEIQVAGAGLALRYRVSWDITRPTPFTGPEKVLLRQSWVHLPDLFG